EHEVEVLARQARERLFARCGQLDGVAIGGQHRGGQVEENRQRPVVVAEPLAARRDTGRRRLLATLPSHRYASAAVSARLPGWSVTAYYTPRREEPAAASSGW